MTAARLAAAGVLLTAGLASSRAPSMTPELYGDGVISTADDEFGGALTPDGTTIYFTRSAPHSYRYTILEAHLVKGHWSTPKVAPFSGAYSDSDPVITPDGSKLLWTSDRPVYGVVKHDYDIWMVEREPSGAWSAPIHLPSPLNSDASEYTASMTRDGTMYFSSARERGTSQAFRSRLVNGVWSAPENVTRMIDGADTTAYFDLDVLIAPDERYVLLGSFGRPEGLGNYDMYIAWKRGDGWSKAVHLPPPFNTPARDYSPHLAPDGKTLFISSERSFALDPIGHRMTYAELVGRLRGTLNGSGNIYWVDAKALDAFQAP